jgi:hypothetical protein
MSILLSSVYPLNVILHFSLKSTALLVKPDSIVEVPKSLFFDSYTARMP